MDEECGMKDFDRITQDPAVMGGKPCIRGQRVTVGMILGQLAAGQTNDDIVADFPYLEREDVTQALRYAARRAEERGFQSDLDSVTLPCCDANNEWEAVLSIPSKIPLVQRDR